MMRGNYRPPMHANILCNTRYSIVQKLSDKQSAKVICRFDRLSHMSIGNSSATHAFDYIVLMIKPGLTSCEDFAMALINGTLMQ